MEFYSTIIAPVLEECIKSNFLKRKDRFAKEGKAAKSLCDTVKELRDLFKHLNGEYKKAKKLTNQKQNTEGVENNNDNFIILTAIHIIISKDNERSMKECLDSLGDALAEAITKDNIEEKNIDELNQVFKQTFHQLIGELGNVENAGEKTTVESRQIAYKLLHYGAVKKYLFKKNPENMEWAFQQFSANLAVYALRLDPRPNPVDEKGTLQKIAESWPIIGIAASGTA